MKLFGDVPSRSRKYPGMISIEMINNMKNNDLYLFNKNKFIKLDYNNDSNYKILSEELKCSL